jgi:hypothetical protein
MKLLLSGLDTVECAYYLRATIGCAFDFNDLAAKREAMRASRKRDPVVVAIGGKELLLGRGGQRDAAGGIGPVLEVHRNTMKACVSARGGTRQSDPRPRR